MGAQSFPQRNNDAKRSGFGIYGKISDICEKISGDQRVTLAHYVHAKTQRRKYRIYKLKIVRKGAKGMAA